MNEKSNVNNTNKNNKKPSYQSYKNLNLNRDNNNSTNMRHDSNHSQDINYQNYVPFNYTQPSMTNPYTSLPQFPLDINSYLLYYQTLLSQGGNPSYTLPQINPIYNGFPPLPQMVNYSTPPQNMMQSNSVSNEPLDRHQDISQHIKNLQNMSKFNPHFMKKRNDSNIDELLKLYQENKDFINGGNVENFKRMKNEEIENDEVINDTKIDSNLSQEDKQMSNKVDLPKKDEKEISTQPKDTEINKNDNAQYEEVNPQLKEKENSDNVDKSIKSDDNSDNNKSNTQLNESISPVSKEDNKMKKEAPNSNESNNKNNIETHNKKEIPIEIDHELSEQIKENFEKGIDFNLADLCFSKQQKEEKTTKPEKKISPISPNRPKTIYYPHKDNQAALSSITQPIVPYVHNCSISRAVRQHWCNKYFEEFVKYYGGYENGEAALDALEYEQEVYKKCSTTQSYRTLSLQSFKELRKLLSS